MELYIHPCKRLLAMMCNVTDRRNLNPYTPPSRPYASSDCQARSPQAQRRQSNCNRWAFLSIGSNPHHPVNHVLCASCSSWQKRLPKGCPEHWATFPIQSPHFLRHLQQALQIGLALEAPAVHSSTEQILQHSHLGFEK